MRLQSLKTVLILPSSSVGPAEIPYTVAFNLVLQHVYGFQLHKWVVG